MRSGRRVPARIGLVVVLPLSSNVVDGMTSDSHGRVARVCVARVRVGCVYCGRLLRLSSLCPSGAECCRRRAVC